MVLKMEFDYIKKYLGEDWLKKQIIFIESKNWITEERRDNFDYDSIAYFILERLYFFRYFSGINSEKLSMYFSIDRFMIVLKNLFVKFSVSG